MLVMPADGVISQLGHIEDDKILQAKGHNYSLEALLAGNYLMADLFRNGTFATTYLSPRATITACTCRATASCVK